ncbi:MAG: hypothetical protein M3Q33_08200 [Acidobacteriota bacterium]|nr:hypothetical protein [Acidobacteriota bacterium]
MTKPKTIFTTAAFFIVCLMSLTNSFAQTETRQRQAEPSYEVVLHILTASNSASDKMSVPPTLSNVVKKLKTIYSFSNYRLDSTYLQRVANTGNIEFKSVTNEANQNQENYIPIFSEWTLGGLQSLPDSKGQNSIQFQNFRFGQRIPIRTSSYKDENGKTNNVVNYEQIGLTMQRFGVPENVPTIVGSLSTTKPDELMFLVLTVKPAQE